MLLMREITWTCLHVPTEHAAKKKVDTCGAVNHGGHKRENQPFSPPVEQNINN